MTELSSERVRLIAATTDMLTAEDTSTTALAEMLGIPTPQLWPPEHNGPQTRSWLREMMAAHPEAPTWFSWYAVAKEDNALAGIVGYKGPPDDQGHVEIGYSVIPTLQRRGLATEAVRLLCNRAFADPRVTAVVAHTLPELAASQRVLEKNGFTKVEELQDPDAGPVWRYQRDP